MHTWLTYSELKKGEQMSAGWWLKSCFTSTETVGLLGTGAQDVHLDFHTAPELWDVSSGSPSLISLVVSVDIEHYVYTYLQLWALNSIRGTPQRGDFDVE